MPSPFDLLNKITKKKRSQTELLQYLREHDLNLHDKLRSCASYLLIREWIQTSETRLRSANFCKRYQVCPSCAVRRGAKLAESALPKILSVLAENPHLAPVHVTLTLPNTKDLNTGFDALRAAWTQMVTLRRKGLSSSSRHDPIEWCKVHGGIRSIEVTNKGNGWHPHIHCLVLVDSFFDLKKLSKEFHSFGGGSIVWATKVSSSENALVPALLEVLKYPTKFSSLSPEKLYHFYKVVRKSRLTDTFGNLRGVHLGDIDQDDLDLPGPYRDWVARWYNRAQRYRMYPADAWDDPQSGDEVELSSTSS